MSESPKDKRAQAAVTQLSTQIHQAVKGGFTGALSVEMQFSQGAIADLQLTTRQRVKVK